MIRATKLKLYAKAMQTHGFAPTQVLEGSGIEANRFRDPDYLIDLWQEKKVLANIIRLAGDQPAAFLLTRDLEISDLGVLGHTLTTCETLSKAAQLWRTYSPLLLGQMICNDLQPARNELHVVFTEMAALGPLLSFCVEESLMLGKLIGENLLKTPFAFSRLSVTYPQPAYYRIYEELLKCPVEFNAKINRITIVGPATTNQTRQPDIELHEVCLKQCERVREKASSSQPWASRVRNLLARNSTPVNLDEVANALHTSGRSLRRHLHGEGVNFQQIINEHRFDMAREYMTGTHLTNQEIGFLLGYRDTKAFFRAFKEWTGHTVSDYREEHSRTTHSG